MRTLMTKVTELQVFGPYTSKKGYADFYRWGIQVDGEIYSQIVKTLADVPDLETKEVKIYYMNVKGMNKEVYHNITAYQIIDAVEDAKKVKEEE